MYDKIHYKFKKKIKKKKTSQPPELGETNVCCWHSSLAGHTRDEDQNEGAQVTATVSFPSPRTG